MALFALFVLGDSMSFLSGTMNILSSISSAIFINSFLDHRWSLLLLQVYLLGWFVNLRAVRCMTQAGTLRFEFAAFISLFFFGYDLWLDMVSTSS
jgi:hypothetical protein